MLTAAILYMIRYKSMYPLLLFLCNFQLHSDLPSSSEDSKGNMNQHPAGRSYLPQFFTHAHHQPTHASPFHYLHDIPATMEENLSCRELASTPSKGSTSGLFGLEHTQPLLPLYDDFYAPNGNSLRNITKWDVCTFLPVTPSKSVTVP